MRRTWAALVCSICWTSLTLPVSAQDPNSPYEDVGTASYSGSTAIGWQGGYLYFRKDFDNGVGYRNGFTNVGWFQPFQSTDNSTFFGQGQIFVTDDGQVGGNIGGGYRYYMENSNRVLGAYGFLDTDESVNDNRYDQFSIGVESLGSAWDFRANAYLPLSSDDNFLGLQSLTIPPVFRRNNLVFNGTGFMERAQAGGDVEFGFPILDPGPLGRLRAYIGGYAYDSETKNLAGARARLESHLNEYVTVGAAFYHDDLHGGMATMSLDIRGWNGRLPDLNTHSYGNRGKLYLPVVRSYRVATERFVGAIQTPALGPDGTPLEFVWVDNSNAGPGDGTFEDPFSAMPGTAPGADYILARRGDSSLVNPILGGIALEDDQRMFGEGIDFDVTVTSTVFGLGAGIYAIDTLDPTWATAGPHPFLRNPAGDVITLADRNEVGGFNIVSSAGHGVTGTGITDFTLFNLFIGNSIPAFGNAGTGIELTDASGVGTIENFTLLNNAGGGLRVLNTSAAALTLDVAGATGIDPNVTGGAVGLEILADDSVIVATIENFNNSSSDVGGMVRVAAGGDLDLMVGDSRFDDAAIGDGLDVAVDAATLALQLEDVTANTAALNGFHLELTSGATFTGLVSGSALGESSFSGALGGHGVLVTVDGSPNPDNFLAFMRTVIDGNAFDGIHTAVTGGSVFSLHADTSRIAGNTGDGIDAAVDGGSTLNLISNTTNVTSSLENGFRFDARSGSTLVADFFQVNLTGNTLNGILGTLDTASSVTHNFEQTHTDANGEHGMLLTALGGSTFVGNYESSSFNDNNQTLGGGDGINALADASTVTLNLQTTQVSNSPFPVIGTQENGLSFIAQNGATFTFNADNSTFNNHTFDGIVGEVHDATTVATVDLDGTLVDSNDSNGVHLIVDTDATLNALFANGSVSNNTDYGVLIEASDVSTVIATSLDNTFSVNGASGVLIDLVDFATLTGNFRGGDISGNGNVGFLLTTDDDASYSLSLGGPLLTDGIVFNSNVDAGVGVIMSGDSTGTMSVLRGEFTGTISGGDPDFSGQGIHVRVLDNAVFDGGNVALIFGNEFTENDSNGVDFFVSDTGTIGGVIVFGNTFENNGGNGIQFLRTDSGTIGSLASRVRIFSNTITQDNGSTFDGVFLVAADAPSTDYYNLAGNDIFGLTGSGVHYEVRDDASIDADMDDNFLDSNVLDGVLVTEVAAGADLRSVTGTWTNNLITNNIRHGINIQGNTASLEIGDVAAAAFPPPLFNGNQILGNAHDGVSLNGTGSVTIAGNLIDGNGSGDADDAGIDIHSSSNTVAAANTVTIIRNAITNNLGDGIELDSDASVPLVLDITENNIALNTGRGFDVLVQPSSLGTNETEITFDDNIVQENGLEGVYVVFTASRTQGQSADSTVALLSNGNIDDAPHLRFSMDNNTIIDNGANSTFPTTGLVVRVGTTDAPASLIGPPDQQIDQFVSDGSGIGAVFLNGGVIMEVTNNTFNNNTGDDVYFESFTSTVNPAAVTGTWNAVTFSASGRGDPLARLDLFYSGNISETGSATNVGAFYANPEGTFKSRLDTAVPAGPFDSATRRRNAQRIAARIPAFDEPLVSPDAGTFLYSGMGASTFRVQFGGGDDPGFIFDTDPYNDTGDAAGIGFGGAILGELPFGWGTLP